MFPKQKSLKTLQKEVADFNSKYSVGDAITIMLDGGTIKETSVKHLATILGGHTAVGWFEGVSGCYNLRSVLSEKKSHSTN